MHTDAGGAGARMDTDEAEEFLIRVCPCFPSVCIRVQKTFVSAPAPNHARRIAISMLGRMMEAVR